VDGYNFGRQFWQSGHKSFRPDCFLARLLLRLLLSSSLSYQFAFIATAWLVLHANGTTNTPSNANAANIVGWPALHAYLASALASLTERLAGAEPLWDKPLAVVCPTGGHLHAAQPSPNRRNESICSRSVVSFKCRVQSSRLTISTRADASERTM